MRTSSNLSSKLTIGFLPLYDINGPSSRYRVFQFLQPLEQQGFQCRLLPAPQRNLFKRLAYLPRLFLLALQSDVLFIQKRTLPIWVLNLLVHLNPRIIYDFDDAIFLQPAHKDCLDEMLKRAKVVIAGNEYLASYARKYQSPVVVIPTVVDTDRYKPAVSASRSGGERIVLGWIGSDPNADGLELLLPVFQWLERRYGSGLLVRMIAGKNWRANPSVPIEYVPWRLETSLSELQRLDIGLAPLKDTEWNRGKCGLKLIQYMAVGIPAVASPVGVQSQIVEHNRSGFLASSLEDWRSALVSLIEDKLLRLQMGNEARRRAETYFSVRAVMPALSNIIAQVAT